MVYCLLWFINHQHSLQNINDEENWCHMHLEFLPNLLMKTESGKGCFTSDECLLDPHSV